MFYLNATEEFRGLLEKGWSIFGPSYCPGVPIQAMLHAWAQSYQNKKISNFRWIFLKDRHSLDSPGFPRIHHGDQAGLELRDPPASASRVPGLKEYPHHIWQWCIYFWWYTIVFGFNSQICLVAGTSFLLAHREYHTVPFQWVLVLVMFRQPCWWDFMDTVILAFLRDTVSLQTPCSCGSHNPSTPSSMIPDLSLGHRSCTVDLLNIKN